MEKILTLSKKITKEKIQLTSQMKIMTLIVVTIRLANYIAKQTKNNQLSLSTVRLFPDKS